MSAPGTPSPSGEKPAKKRWFAYFGANSLALSILIHVLFGVGATYLIVEHFQKKHINFHATEPPAQHDEVEHKVQLAKRNNVESAPPDLKRIVTTDVSSITLPDVPEVPTTDEATPTVMTGVDGVMGTGVGMGQGAGNGNGGGGADMPLFGTPDGVGLKGYLYDLKQYLLPTKKKQTMNPEIWRGIMADYVAHKMDDSMLDAYFRSKTPLYATTFTISTRHSEEAPKAFKLENEVQPALWCIHYHGEVAAPETGDYRFAGFGDDLLVVRINYNLVLDAGWVSVTNQPEMHQTLPTGWSKFYGNRESPRDEIPGMGPTNGLMKMGATFHMQAGVPADMDVLIGDQGGEVAFFLLVQKMGNTYQKLPDGTPILPFFQLNHRPAPTFAPGEEHPPYSLTTEPWQMGDSIEQ